MPRSTSPRSPLLATPEFATLRSSALFVVAFRAAAWLPAVLALLASPGVAAAQANPGSARITEEIRTLETYPFSEPNPVPILVRDARIYPYHTFEGYSSTSQPQDWKVVKLENDYIEVFVLPEVGGKVWGAVVKETGHEFIYRNEVMKFRNIALRGPWTSGGIEFNFGVIGHAPATATPVDYKLVENDDGSVSCWVGSMDLPSRTHWRVEIRLPADRAYFETNVLWYNPTPLEQPYYNWMTAAAFARDDLEMTMPGNAYLQHSGQEETWPLDEEGRYLPLYGNNTFGSHKSYHVVGELNDFFGGYYHDDDYGFGHWARHEDMPGQKLWLWSLARDGGVWEELLTDTDGQYVEFQAGRLFVQYSPGSHLNPITQASFDPMSASRWTETWFPLEGIGGLTDASKEGAMFAEEEGGVLTIGVNAFRDIQDTLKVWSDGDLVSTEAVTLETLVPFHASFNVVEGEDFRVQLAGLELDYESDPRDRQLVRPFERDLEEVPALSETDQKLFDAKELMKARYYREAKDLFEEVRGAAPWNREALLGLAELAYRNGEANETLFFAKQALQLDAYDAKANFLFGLAYKAAPNAGSLFLQNAKDAFGWAARSTTYRSAANVELAEIMIREEDWEEAERYARLAIDYDRHSIPGWRALAVVGRKADRRALADEALGELLALDPLHHFAFAEEYLGAATDAGDLGAADPRVKAAAEAFRKSLGGEFPDQTLLEITIYYFSLELRADALEILTHFEKTDPQPPIHQAWVYWLTEAADPGPEDLSVLGNPADPAFQFPFRHETHGPLSNASGKTGHWVWTYLNSLLNWANDQDAVATNHFEIPEDSPDFAPYYVARAHLLARTRNQDPEPDLRKAVELEPDTRIFHIYLIQHLERQEEWDAALMALGDAKRRFPGDFNLDLLQAKALINLGRGSEAAEILAITHVLPSENARESHQLWVQAHTLAALDAYDTNDFQVAKEHLLQALEWPESLGQGRPYDPEERLVRFILGRVEQARGNENAAQEALQAYLDATGEVASPLSRLDLLAVSALESLGRLSEAEALRVQSRSEGEALRGGLQNDVDGRLLRRALNLEHGRRNFAPAGLGDDTREPHL